MLAISEVQVQWEVLTVLRMDDDRHLHKSKERNLCRALQEEYLDERIWIKMQKLLVFMTRRIFLLCLTCFFSLWRVRSQPIRSTIR